ncbi:putative type I fatty acid synthase, partial [Toxoplasma gondii VEG]
MVWLFTGQGSQYVNMAKSLYETEESFRQTVKECSAYLATEKLLPTEGPSSLEDIIYPGQDADAEEAEHLLMQTQYSQVAIFVVELALTRVLKERGLRPAAVLGHSLGEYAAAVTAGVFSWRDALRVVAVRARIMSEQDPQDGVMAACRLSAAEVQAALDSDLKNLKSVAVAADNGPRSVVVSGRRSEVEEVLSFFSISGRARFLRVSHAFHSPLMAGAVEPVSRLFERVEFSKPAIPFISTVLGRLAVGSELSDALYWSEQITKPVRFREAIHAATSGEFSAMQAYIEVGPSRVLAAMGRDCDSGADGTIHEWLCTVDPRSAANPFEAIATLQERFAQRLPMDESVRHTWNHSAFPWTVPRHPLIGKEMPTVSAAGGEQVSRYSSRVRLDVLDALRDHVILGMPLMPGAAFIDALLAAGRLEHTRIDRRISSSAVIKLSDVSIFSPLLLPESLGSGVAPGEQGFHPSSLELSVEMKPDGRDHLAEVRSRRIGTTLAAANEEEYEQSHCRGRLAISAGTSQLPASTGGQLTDLQRRFYSEAAVDVSQLYATFAELGWQYGKLFRPIAQLFKTDTEAFAELRLPRPVLPCEEGFIIHPAILDGLFQVAGSLLLTAEKAPAGSVYVPIGVDELAFIPSTSKRDIVWGRVTFAEADDEAKRRQERVVNCTLYDEGGRVLLYVSGLRSRLLRTEVLLSGTGAAAESNKLWSVEWRASHQQPVAHHEEPVDHSTNWLIAGVHPAVQSQLEEFFLKTMPGAKVVFCAPSVVATDVRRLLQQEAWNGIIHIGGVTASISEMECLSDVLVLLQAVIDWQANESSPRPLPAMFLVTRGACCEATENSGLSHSLAPVHSGMRGLFRTAKAELEALWNRFVPLHYINIEPSSDKQTVTPEELRQVFSVIQQQGAKAQFIQDQLTQEPSKPLFYESESLLRDGELLLPRLVPASLEDCGDGNALAEAMTGTIVITGGLGGIGLVLAKWLTGQEARAVVLVSRTGTPSAEVQRSEDWHLLQSRRQHQTRIVTASCDVGDREQVKLLFRSLRAGSFVCHSTGQVVELPPIRGIFHAAGVLRDCPIQKQDAETLASVFRPKSQGAWNIHNALEELNMNEGLKVFLMFSSIASLVGNPGQANYAAANSSLDALASYRRCRGLAGHSIQWGPWIEQGMAAELGERLERAGFRGISNKVGVEVTEAVVSQGTTGDFVVACQEFIWPRFVMRYRGCLPAIFEEQTRSVTVRMRDERSSRQAAGPEMHQESAFASMAPDELRALIQATVSGAAKQVLGTAEEPPADAPLQALGIDSLGAVEFRNAVQDAFDIRLSATLLFDYPSVQAVSDHLWSMVRAKTAIDTSSRGDDQLASAAVLQDTGVSIAVVGMACRLPGSVNDLEAFEEMLLTFQDCIQEIPPSRFSIEEVYDPDPDAKGKIYVREGGFIDGAELFDNRFFGISDAEAREMDPRQRISLEVSYEALVDAGYSREDLLGSPIGVFVGAMNHDKLYDDLRQLTSYSGTSTALAILANRLSFTFGLTGPSLMIDSACSSSLVAVDYANMDLRQGRSEVALVAGVNIMPTTDPYVHCCKARMLSPDCRCKTFAANANGYVRSEGCAALLLERTATPKRRNITPYGRLLGTANNHVGRSASITSPNGPAQQA